MAGSVGGDIEGAISHGRACPTPQPDDRVTAEGEDCRVVRVSPVGTAGTAHYYDMQVRRDPAV